MKLIVFGLLTLALTCGHMGWAKGPIEIVVQGVEYPSIEAYKASKAQKKGVLKGPADNQDDQMMADKAKELGLDYDPDKVKTIALEPVYPITPQVAEKLDKAGMEHGVRRVVTDFTQNWNDPMPKLTIQAEELENRLKALIGDRPDPVLLVSDQEKIRVMTLEKSAQPNP